MKGALNTLLDSILLRLRVYTCIETRLDYLMNYYIFVLQSPAKIRNPLNSLQNDYSVSPSKINHEFLKQQNTKMVLYNFIIINLFAYFMTYFSVPNRSSHNFFIRIRKLFDKPLPLLHRLLILLFFIVVTIYHFTL